MITTLDFAKVPASPGVYVFTEYATPLKPNAPRPMKHHPDYVRAMEKFRVTPCVLYVGKASNLNHRLRGYRFRPYLEIQRRDGKPRHVADRHKGRALLHAGQFTDFSDGPVYLRWILSSSAKQLETDLIRELHPILNTLEVQFLEPPED